MNHTPRYLLIDDDESFQKIVERAASEMNISVRSVSSIKEIPDLKLLALFDAIFLDYDLDDGTGFEVAELLKKEAEGKPIVMVSSTNRPYQDKLGALPNIIGFVSKWAKPRDFMLNALGVVENRPGIKVAA